MDIKLKFGIAALLIILFQSIIKLLGVILTGSLSFLSETVDTLTDIFFVSLTIYSLYISQKPADYEHMYGHAKIDSIGAMIQGIVLVILYSFLVFLAVQTIINAAYSMMNPDVGFNLLILSFIVNLIFSRTLIWQGRKRNSLILRIQGLNLFQDSLRAIVVIINFLLALIFGIKFLDPFFSIILSLWIILSSIKLSKEGIENLIDINPISSRILEEMRQNIFNLEHVNAIEDLKVRVSANTLFLEIHLSVEDHISIAHADEIDKAIHALSKKIFPSYDVECIVEMNPLSGESSIGEEILNLLESMKSEFNEIIEFRDLGIFRIESDYFLSLAIIVDENLSLKDAHDTITKFENQLKEQVPYISRIITHIESETRIKKIVSDQLICTPIEPEKKKEIQTIIEKELKKVPEVKGYHGLEFWTALDFCVLELHVFFDGFLNISLVHNIITNLERNLKELLLKENLTEIILHSEPIQGRTDGIIF
jgi:cation diffusion facilitator family transporter